MKIYGVLAAEMDSLPTDSPCDSCAHECDGENSVVGSSGNGGMISMVSAAPPLLYRR